MNHKLTLRINAAVAALFALSAGSLSAQSPSAAGETIKLEEFNVSAARASGYRATNSITATGIGTNIADAPVPINVLTGDFIKDVNEMRLSDAMVYVPGVAIGSYESVIQIRGFQGLQLYRNGFYRRQSYPTWNIDRVEVIKGAASVFFGVVRPGGVVNYLTGKPTFDGNSTELRLSLGSDDYSKGELYSNVKVSDTLAVRVGLGAIEGGAWRDKDFNRQSYQGLAATWRVAKDQELTLDLEHVYWKFTDLRGVDLAMTNARYYGNPAAVASNQGVAAWVAANLPAGTPVYDTWVNPNPKGRRYKAGADVWSDQESYTADLTYRAKLSNSLVFTSAVNFARDFFEEIRTISNDQSPFADGTFAYQFGNFGNIRDSKNFNNKLVWRFDVAGTKNTAQFGQEYFYVVQRTPGIFTAANAFQDGFRTATFRENAAAAAQRSGMDAFRATGLSFNADRRRKDDFYGYFIMNQTEMFEGRLHLLYGARYNNAKRNVAYTRAVTNAEPASKAKKTTPEYGALFKVTKEVSLFATYSETLEAPFGADADGKPVDAVNNTGYDLGLKTSLLDNRVSGTVTYYYEKRDHVATRDSAREALTGRQPFFIYNSTAVSRGVEADLNFALVDGWSLMLGYTHDLQNEYTRSTDALLRGQPLGGVPKDFVTVWNRYDFKQGDFKGFYLAGGVRISSDARVTTDQIGINANNVVRRAGYTVADVTVGYRFKAAGHSFTTSLDVKNIADRYYRDGIDGGWAAPRRFFLTVGTKF